MAKSQDISLTPEEITGMCGRLRCCLNYEYETYEEARKNLPKRKKMVQTPMGEGKVIQVLPLSDWLLLNSRRWTAEFTLEELQTGKLAEKTSAPVESPPMPEEIKGEVEILSYGVTCPRKQEKPVVNTAQARETRPQGRTTRQSSGKPTGYPTLRRAPAADASTAAKRTPRYWQTAGIGGV